MKNIHILPTDKPSRLFEIFQFNFIFDNENKYSEEYKKNHKYKNKNIYITSNEEIKEGDYICASGGFRFVKTLNKDKARTFEDDGIVSKQNPSSSCHLSNYKKIILTTDVDLIKNGVQAIDDEFLAWFVKNPSCDEVEIIKQHQYHSSKEFYIDADYVNCSEEQYESIKEEIPTCPLRILYKIIIPKEEPCDNCNSEVCCCIIRPQETLEEAVNKFKKTDVYINEIKQETLEETAKNESEYLADWEDKDMYVKGFIDGAECQAEQDQNKYSEEEVLQLIINCKERFGGSDLDDYVEDSKVIKWFEQFKKK